MVLIVQVFAIKNRCAQVWPLSIATVLQLLFARLFQEFNMFFRLFLVLSQLLSHFCTFFFILLVKLSSCFLCLFCNLLIHFELFVYLLLSITLLSKQHLPTSNVVRSLVLVSHQISFYQWRVSHTLLRSLWFSGILLAYLC